jgi:hypothetical protein
MPLSVLKDIRRIYAGLNAEKIRRAAHRDMHIGLMAASEEGYNSMEQFLVPEWLPERRRQELMQTIHRVEGAPGNHFDFILCEPGIPVPANGYPFDAGSPDSTALAIAADQDDLELAIARRYPRLRFAVADNLIRRVSRENALFALITALPNIVPSVLDLPWAAGEFATDTAFLTMNQIRMALSLAAAHDLPVGYAEQKVQIAAIAAGAFGWRAAARELAGKIPLGGGLIPKAAVAFAGTWAVGWGLEKLHRTGAGFSRSERKAVYTRGLIQGRQVAREIAPAVAKQS